MKYFKTSQVMSFLFVLFENILPVDAGTVYSCYGSSGPSNSPFYSMGTALAVVNKALNCDSTVSATSDGQRYTLPGLNSARLYNSANNGKRDPSSNIISSFDYLINSFCASGLGYWYYDGNDHTTGVIDSSGFPHGGRDLSENTTLTAISSDSPFREGQTMSEDLDSLHSIFGGTPQSIFYLPTGVELPDDAAVSEFEISFEDLTRISDIQSADQIQTRQTGQLQARSLRTRESPSKSKLATRGDWTCRAVGAAIDAANGFRIWRTSSSRTRTVRAISAGTCDLLATRLVGYAQNNANRDANSQVVVDNGSAMGADIFAMGETLKSAIALVTVSALNTLFFDMALDMSRSLNSDAVYEIADGTGYVVLRIVAWARYYPS